jgi:XTP/dITP diphosphohydrolase
MKRKFDSNTLVLATHNKGKIGEIERMLGPYIQDFDNEYELGLDEPEETGVTFEENASLKALAAARATGKVSLADDSGLCVVSLNGDPGVYSARWAGPKRDFSVAMKKIETALDGVEDKSAAFVCVLALAWPDGHVETVRGTVEGHLVFPARGTHGFGYDPIFVPEGFDQTFAEMKSEEKHKLSHRAQAFERLLELFPSTN